MDSPDIDDLLGIPEPEPPAHQPRYTEDDHRRAFEIWLVNGSYREVEVKSGIPMYAAVAWAKAEYTCRFGCPWHGWEHLREAQKKAVRKELAPVAEKREREFSMAQAPAAPKPPSRYELVRRIVRSDLERLAQLEVLYAKAFYDATGVNLGVPQLIDDQGNVIQAEEILRRFAGSGVKSKSYEQAIRCVSMILSEINKILDSSGLRRAKPEDETPAAASSVSVEDLSIEEVRHVRELHQRYLQTSPEKREALKRLLESEDGILSAQLSDDGSNAGATKPADPRPLLDD